VGLKSELRFTSEPKVSLLIEQTITIKRMHEEYQLSGILKKCLDNQIKRARKDSVTAITFLKWFNAFHIP
jgi:hypothetical protein